MRLPYLLVDAFAEAPGSGNRAAVLFAGTALEESAMKAIPTSLGVNEAVFVSEETDHEYRIRFFTARRELRFAGHAAIAAAIAIHKQRNLSGKKDRIVLKTIAGDVAVWYRLESGALIAVLREPDPKFRETPRWATISAILEALGGNERYLHRGLPAGIAFSGLWSLLLPLVAPGLADELEPDYAKLAELSDDLRVDTIHVYAPLGPRSYYARDFAPSLGISEDPVTASANGALAALLARAGVVPRREGSAEIRIYQGYSMGIPGRVNVKVEYSISGEPLAVYVGGSAVIVKSGFVEVK